MKEVIYELCPHCNVESEILWDITAQGYVTKCPSCGETLNFSRDSSALPGGGSGE